MIYNSLNNPIKIRLTSDQTKALEVLKSKGFNKSKFIRAAIDEKLYNEYRIILSDIKKTEDNYCPF